MRIRNNTIAVSATTLAACAWCHLSLAALAFGLTPVLAAAPAPRVQEDDFEAKLVAIGKRAPSFTIPTPTGGLVSLANATRGSKAVIVNFWFHE